MEFLKWILEITDISIKNVYTIVSIPEEASDPKNDMSGRLLVLSHLIAYRGTPCFHEQFSKISNESVIVFEIYNKFGEFNVPCVFEVKMEPKLVSEVIDGPLMNSLILYNLHKMKHCDPYYFA